MKLNEIIRLIELKVPKCYAADWDNVGLMIGDAECEINKIMLTLDVTPAVVEQAVKSHCDLIVSHHPFFFDSIKNIDFSTPMGSMIQSLITNKICVYSCHTNMDSANVGINATLAAMYELLDVEVLEANENFRDVGIGRIGNLKNKCTLNEMCVITKKLLNVDALKVVADHMDMSVQRVCVASGSCGDLIGLAKEKFADVIITSDVKYHQALKAHDMGIAVIDAGHFYTEFLVTDIFKALLIESGLEMEIAPQKDCFRFV